MMAGIVPPRLVLTMGQGLEDTRERGAGTAGSVNLTA